MNKKFSQKNIDRGSLDDEFQQERSAAQRKFSEQDRKDFWKNFDPSATGSNRNPANTARKLATNNRDVDNRPTQKATKFGEKKFDKTGDKREGKSFDRDRKPFEQRGDRPERKSFGDKKPFEGKRFEDRGDRNDRKPFDRDRKPFEGKRFEDRGDRNDRKTFDRDRKPFEGKRFEDRGDRNDRKPFDRDRKPFEGKRFEDRGDRTDRKPFDRDRKPFEGKRFEDRGDRTERKPFDKDRKTYGDKPAFKKDFDKTRNFEQKPFDKRRGDDAPGKDKKDRQHPDKFMQHFDYENPVEMAYDTSGNKGVKTEQQTKGTFNEMPLNKYIAHCGVCSRRDAVLLIKEKKVTVNNKVIEEPGFKIAEGDIVQLEGKEIKVQKNLLYLLLNKPKGFITTTDDPKGRRTVMDIFGDNIDERVFPIGRLDRNTTGLLLLTNDGDLAQQLSHPKYENRKIYQVTLNKNVSKPDFEKILGGLELEDGVTKVDQLAYLENKNEIGIEIHSGKNRIVRRIFESLGYEVEKLDRVMYAGLTKKNLKRGQWRFLTKQEIINLKHMKR